MWISQCGEGNDQFKNYKLDKKLSRGQPANSIWVLFVRLVGGYMKISFVVWLTWFVSSHEVSSINEIMIVSCEDVSGLVD